MKYKTHIFLSKVEKDKAILYSKERGKFYKLNSTSYKVWEKCNEDKTIEEIIDELAQETAVDRNEVERMVKKAIEILKENELIYEIC